MIASSVIFSDLTVTCFLIHCYVSWKDLKSEHSNGKLNVPVSLVGRELAA